MAGPIFHCIHCCRTDILLHAKMRYLIVACVMYFLNGLATDRWSFTSQILQSELVLGDIRFVLALLRARSIARVTKSRNFFEFVSVAMCHLHLRRRVNPCCLIKYKSTFGRPRCIGLRAQTAKLALSRIVIVVIIASLTHRARIDNLTVRAVEHQELSACRLDPLTMAISRLL